MANRVERHVLVLVPASQTTVEGCRAGRVKLTGTPGAGSWEEWGPYPLLGVLDITPGAPLAGDPAVAAVPSVP